MVVTRLVGLLVLFVVSVGLLDAFVGGRFDGFFVVGLGVDGIGGLAVVDGRRVGFLEDPCFLEGFTVVGVVDGIVDDVLLYTTSRRPWNGSCKLATSLFTNEAT